MCMQLQFCFGFLVCFTSTESHHPQQRLCCRQTERDSSCQSGRHRQEAVNVLSLKHAAAVTNNKWPEGQLSLRDLLCFERGFFSFLSRPLSTDPLTEGIAAFSFDLTGLVGHQAALQKTDLWVLCLSLSLSLITVYYYCKDCLFCAWKHCIH